MGSSCENGESLPLYHFAKDFKEEVRYEISGFFIGYKVDSCEVIRFEE